jgi:hypothetical protein
MMVVVASRSLRFADTARLLADTVRQGGLTAPTFRSPPRVLGRDRTLRRRSDGSVAVAVRLGGRPFVAVVADMVEGVIRTNGLDGPEADEWRRALWTAVESGAALDVREAA